MKERHIWQLPSGQADLMLPQKLTQLDIEILKRQIELLEASVTRETGKQEEANAEPC